MSLGSILCCFGCLFGVYFGAIWGSIWGQVGVNLGSIWGPKSDFNLRPLFNTFLTPFRTPLGPQVGPNLEALGRLGAILGPCISHHLSNALSNLILNRFRTPKRSQNQSNIDQKSMPKSRSEKDLISAALRFNFEENLMLMPKETIFKNHAKPLCFCTFFEHSFISMKRKNDFNTSKKIIKHPMGKHRFFERK